MRNAFRYQIVPSIGIGKAALLALTVTFLLATSHVVLANSMGSIFLTGHDPDFHAQSGNTAGARDLNKVAIGFIMDPAFNPFVAHGVTKFLFVESNIAPPGGHLVGEQGIIDSGFTAGVNFDAVDATGLGAALKQLGTVYAGIVVASDFGGDLTQAELNILDADSAGIISFLNQGGGLYAMAESAGSFGLTTSGDFAFLPFVVSSTALNQSEVGNTLTAFGASLGLTSGDINGNVSHNIFDGTFGLNIVDQDPKGDILSLAGRGKVTGGGVSTVPEVSAWILLASGLVGLGVMSLIRRRVKSAPPIF